MVVGYGVSVPEGHLPVYSVDTEREAKSLIVLACETNARGEYIAKELAEEQTIESLMKFGDRLEKAWRFLQKRKTE